MEHQIKAKLKSYKVKIVKKSQQKKKIKYIDK